MFINVKFLMTYIKTTKCYFYYLIAQVILISTSTIYLLGYYGDKGRHQVLDYLEAFLTIVCLLETLTRFLTEGKAFFHNYWNILDTFFVASVLCLFSISIFFDDVNNPNQENFWPVIFLGCRYSIQLSRLYTNLKHNQKMRGNKDMDFDLDAQHEDEGHSFIDVPISSEISPTKMQRAKEDVNNKGYESPLRAI